MPSWDVHARVAEVLGVDPRRQNEVDRLIDTVFHDIGRRMPHEYIFEDERVARMFGIFERRIVERVRSDPEFRLMFALHHATDILGYVAPSVEVLWRRGIPVDVRLAAEVRLRNDLAIVERNVGVSLSRVIDMILDNLDEAVKALEPWTSRALRERERYVKVVPVTPAAAVRVKTHVHKRVMLVSNLLDYLLVHYDGPLWLFTEYIASGSMKRATLLRDILRGVCTRLEYLDKLTFEAIEKTMIEKILSSIRFRVKPKTGDDYGFVALDEGIAKRLAVEYARLYVRYCLYYAWAASRLSGDTQSCYPIIFWNCFCKIPLGELTRLRGLPEGVFVEVPLEEMLAEVRCPGWHENHDAQYS